MQILSQRPVALEAIRRDSTPSLLRAAVNLVKRHPFDPVNFALLHFELHVKKEFEVSRPGHIVNVIPAVGLTFLLHVAMLQRELRTERLEVSKD